ncbi:hypothetical protein A2331_02600 [Candidatus Falkowbacteria bacterium RIFOXYB2_FULL_34_18]|nr:MAG: hypothetical protein A2331_02600 [Candidatus Falkowbacteria bacterium RIFOXYB2_FULL_34_18]OGF29630.1 MAG: hypothetical protein A2500_00630 [Candidatus Falkowbacteria bacterium RIFOXYC12_FULL_34_55]OGF39095.1 MAG: hypothetical protein A2515_00050 [Candidatus Falkowbacteria bacterium RIFOXYD12_FULL_34_57]
MKILGITHPITHNNAACILVDGKLVAFAEEERFIRYKNAPKIPAKWAMDYCLRTAGLKLEDIDYIAVGYGDWYKCIWPNFKSQSPGRAIAKTKSMVRQLRWFRWFQPFDFRDPRVINVNHHMAHAASSFFVSGMDKANIMTLDGSGDSESGILAYGEGANITAYHHVSREGSWGSLYEMFTKVLGFQAGSEEGKTMGLASLGIPDIGSLDFIDWEADPVPRIIPEKRDEFLKKIKRRERGGEITDYHKNLAASLQAALEKTGLMMVEYLYKKTGSKNLCLAGGVALNCSMNGKLLQSEFVDNIYIQPASSDAGTALGAAIHVHVEKTGKKPDFIMDHAYWGPEYSNEEIEPLIKECKVAKWRKCDDVCKEAAKKLADNKIVGWFQGRLEIGPRALGNRSILGNPSNPKMKDMINKYVKKREDWRPFAPSMLEEYAADYVEGYFNSPFMILAFNVREDKKDEIISASHLDHTVRVQSVSKRTNPRYWHLIDNFRKITGVPVVINTSFNIAGEPIVCSPRDALRTFFASGMDCLAIGDYLIEKD